jgi:receptor-type tyrosine-protein phosphatase zeta
MSDRVAQDYEGNLWIANVQQRDRLEGMKYLCNVANNIIRSLVQGEDQRVEPYADSATPQYRAPKLEWHSETPTTAIVGTTKTMKCIFSGYPTPKVTWKRLGSFPILEKNYQTAFNMELTIPQVQYEDAGLYECSASNMKGRPPITKVFDLNVESLPEWVKEPEDVRSAEEENAEFFCEAGGSPPPKIQWTINGRPVEELPYDSRRVITDTSISYFNLTKTDAQVLQCNASNKHGYIFANAYLNVAAEPPSWATAPQNLKVAVGQDTNLTCRVFGAPKPVISWRKNGTEIAVQGQEQIKPRFTVLKNGDLNIVNILGNDKGAYECHAVNKFGQISGAGMLVVRNQTLITKSPESQVVNALSTVVLECEAITDPNEENHLTVEWKYKRESIDYDKDPRITRNKIDKSLRIVGITVEDTGEYTCVADNGLDSDEATATITVQDRPNPPEYLRLLTCGATTASVMWNWNEEDENNNALIEFIVYYNTSFDEPDKYHKALTVSRGLNTATIELSPWSNYTFHVKARNSLGLSDPSEFTPAFCSTPADIPYRNPKGVCVNLRDPSKLIIVWEPMPRIEHNGEGFHYRVAYKEVGVPGAQQKVVEVTNWEQREYVVKGVPTFQKYEFHVQAANNLGISPQKLYTRYGHSGEGEPLDFPENFQVDEESINATSAVFTWSSVDESPERVRGHFLGYKIKYWKSEDPDNVREHKVLLKSVDICPVKLQRGKNRRSLRRSADEETGHVSDLWPWSKITAGVLVMNSGKEGQLSDTIEFETPEGVPGVVPMFEIREVGSHHFGLAWSPPLEPNGIITGYIIEYQQVEGTTLVGEKKELDLIPAGQHNAKVKNLTPSTSYRVTITATTSQGRGLEEKAEDTTKPASDPDKPGIGPFDIGENSINITWVPTADGPSNNPGSEFYVEYKKKGSDEPPQKVYPEGDENWVNISGLDTGDHYEFVVVAVNGDGDETRSDPSVIQIGPRPGEQVENLMTAGWFIVMMCAIAFLLLILIIVCLIKRNRGGKYPVHEKEKLRGRDPDKDDDDGGFGEYTKTDEPDYKKSAGSLESETKPLGESDTDSMAEYGDMDAGKFNEDGSFIGQYGGKKKPEEKMEPDATSPNALSTFV